MALDPAGKDAMGRSGALQALLATAAAAPPRSQVRAPSHALPLAPPYPAPPTRRHVPLCARAPKSHLMGAYLLAFYHPQNL